MSDSDVLGRKIKQGKEVQYDRTQTDSFNTVAKKGQSERQYLSKDLSRVMPICGERAISIGGNSECKSLYMGTSVVCSRNSARLFGKGRKSMVDNDKEVRLCQTMVRSYNFI